MLRENSAASELAANVPLGVFGELVGALEPRASSSVAPDSTSSAGVVPVGGGNADTAQRRTGLAARLRSATVVGGGPMKHDARPDALMTAVHSIRLMNTKTTGETALSKAAFYDHMLRAIDVGKDEQVALADGVKAVKEMDEQRKRRIAGLASPMADPTALKPVEQQQQQSAPLPIPGSPSTAVSTAAAPPAISLAGPTLALASQTGVPRSPSTDSMTNETAGTSGRTKLKGIFTNIIKPTISMNTDDSFIDSNSAGGQGASMAHVRVLHRKLCMTVDDYDKKITESAAERESSILEDSRTALQKVVDDTRKAVTAEYEPKIQHDKCNARISVLERENRIMVEETTRTIDLNKEVSGLTAQIASLRLRYSTADSENKLLIEELARRRLRGNVMREKLRAAQRRLAELEDTFIDEQAEKLEDNEQEDEDAAWEDWCSRVGSAKTRQLRTEEGQGTADTVTHHALSDFETRNLTEPEDAASTIRGLLTVLKRTTNIQPRSDSHPPSPFASMDASEDESEKENDVASRRSQSPSKPHHRPSSAPITGAGAGIPSDEVEMQPVAFARPVVNTVAAKTSAAWAARAVGINVNDDIASAGEPASHQQQPPPAVSSTAAPSAPRGAPFLPPPSHNARAAAFSIAKWVERTTASRPRSAPASRFAAPEALSTKSSAKTPAPLLPSKRSGVKHASGPGRLHLTSSTAATSSLEIIPPRQGTRAPRPASAPSSSRAGHGGLLVGRAHPRLDKLHEGRLAGIAVSGRHI
ncbi:hypothetical protein HDU86_003568 [Geranomyces michiganensis]|nr:hypothetical protein HDU86_003568 [Geranomyces michiganensis]